MTGIPPLDDCEWCGSELTILGVNSEGWIAQCANGHQVLLKDAELSSESSKSRALAFDDPPIWEKAHRLQDAIGDSMERHPMISLYDLIMDDGVVQAWVRSMIGDTDG